MQQNKETTIARPVLEFELGLAGDPGCAVASQPVHWSTCSPALRPLKF